MTCWRRKQSEKHRAKRPSTEMERGPQVQAVTFNSALRARYAKPVGHCFDFFAGGLWAYCQDSLPTPRNELRFTGDGFFHPIESHLSECDLLFQRLGGGLDLGKW